MKKINWENQKQVVEIAKQQYKRLQRAIAIRELTQEEIELMVSIELYRSGILTFQDMRYKIKSYCGY